MQYWDDAGVEADRERLRRHADGDGGAFAEIVAEHVDLVYAAAVRQVRSPELAEEVTQAVFILLSRKAASLGRTVVLAAWLHRTAFYTARNLLRREARRRRHERRAVMALGGEPTVDPRILAPTWQRLSPALDAGVASLREADRQAIVLRFFQRQSLADVGRAMGISEDAAQMRVSRAVGKLRAWFAAAGVTLDTCAMANVMWVNAAAKRAPAHVGVGVARAVARQSAAAAAVAEAVGRSMARAKAGLVATAVAAGVAAVVGTTFLLQRVVIHGPVAVVESRER